MEDLKAYRPDEILSMSRHLYVHFFSDAFNGLVP